MILISCPQHWPKPKKQSIYPVGYTLTAYKVWPISLSYQKCRGKCFPSAYAEGMHDRGSTKAPEQHAHGSKLVTISHWPLAWLIWGPVPIGKPSPATVHVLHSALGGEKTQCSMWNHRLVLQAKPHYPLIPVRMDQVRGSCMRKMEIGLENTPICGCYRLLCTVRSWLSCKGLSPWSSSPRIHSVAHPGDTWMSHPVPPAKGVQGCRRNKPDWKIHAVLEGKLTSEGFHSHWCLVKMGFFFLLGIYTI